jgi:hypothetical protein
VRTGGDADPSSPSSAEVKNRVELYFYSLRAFMAYERVKTTYSRIIWLNIVSREHDNGGANFIRDEKDFDELS